MVQPPNEKAAEEAAKAAQALAPAINESSETVNVGLRWFGGAFGHALTHAAGMLGDWVYARRAWARFQVVEKTRQKLVGKDIPPGVVPDGFLVPLLEACGDAQSEELQDLWAELLARTAQGEADPHPAFVQVLRMLSPDDAEALEQLLREGPGQPQQHPSDLFVTAQGPLSHFEGLGLVKVVTTQTNLLSRVPGNQLSGVPGRARGVTSIAKSSIVITDFGKAFANALGLVVP